MQVELVWWAEKLVWWMQPLLRPINTAAGGFAPTALPLGLPLILTLHFKTPSNIAVDSETSFHIADGISTGMMEGTQE